MFLPEVLTNNRCLFNLPKILFLPVFIDKYVFEYETYPALFLLQVNLVINYDLPVKYENQSEPHYEVYLHRIGRAGRFGRKGKLWFYLFLCQMHFYNASLEKKNDWGSIILQL